MALYAFDGTGQREHEDDTETNVVRFKNLYQGRKFYYDGIGTHGSKPLRLITATTGLGGKLRVWIAEDDLEKTLTNDRDDKIDIIGFSRGAALALEFANEIHERFDGSQRIRFLGLFDTVHSFGLATSSHNFIHDNQVPTCVDHCFHALAMDERRKTFTPTRVAGQEVWFRGVHSDIGGGNGNAGLNAVALHWMLEQHLSVTGTGPERCFTENSLNEIHAMRDVDAAIRPSKLDLREDPYRQIHVADVIHDSVQNRPNHNNPPLDESVP